MRPHQKAVFIVLSLLRLAESASPIHSLVDIGNSLINVTRRKVNLSNLFGSPTTAEPYDQISSQPVFSVTTPWGSPYLLYERIDSSDDKSPLEFDEVMVNGNEKDNYKSERQLDDGIRQVGLFFLDQEDALSLRDEMLQMEQMKGADMRITVTSLGKAMSQAVNLNNGLPTGQAIDTMTGELKAPSDGGSLRYKIVPPKRELYYAARCKGKERVGFFSEDPSDDAGLMIGSLPQIGAALGGKRESVMERRRRINQQNDGETEDPLHREYAHMEGYVGIPIFHCEELKKYSKVKQGILKNNKILQTPLFFSYDDLMDSWTALRDRHNEKVKKSKKKDGIVMMPEKPNVEVFNFVDVVTSMDRDRWNVRRAAEVRRNKLLGKIPLVGKVLGSDDIGAIEVSKVPSGLEQIVFVPSSRASTYKEMVSKIGNGQAQGLRPMKPWGYDTM